MRAQRENGDRQRIGARGDGSGGGRGQKGAGKDRGAGEPEARGDGLGEGKGQKGAGKERGAGESESGRARCEAYAERYAYLVHSAAKRWFFTMRFDEDLLQSGYLGLWKAACRAKPGKPFLPFALVCIRNEMTTYLRCEGRYWKAAAALRPEHEGSGRGRDMSVCGAQGDNLYEAIRACWPADSDERLVLTALVGGMSKAALAAAMGRSVYRVEEIARRAWEEVEDVISR